MRTSDMDIDPFRSLDVRPGARFVVGRTRLEFVVLAVRGDRAIVRGESGRRRELPLREVERRLG